jgi:hypothetical protein
MIFDELNTSFRFYNDLDKQNRYKSNCIAVCDYKLLCPIDTILPFQFRVGYEPSLALSSAYIKCQKDDSIIFDASVYLSLNFNSTSDFTYVIGNELTLKDAIPCGSYYLHLILSSDSGEYNYYSEVFNSTELVSSVTPFTQSLFSLPCAWKWYNNSSKRIENSSPCNILCPYTIVCGNDALIPFQYKVSSATAVTSWILINENCSFTLDVSLITIQTIGSVKNIIYSGDLIDLPCGIYYSEMVIDGITHYSEPIKITNDFETAGTNYILQETGDLLLQENNYGLLQ